MGRGPVQNMASMYMEERIMTSSDKKLNDIQTVVLSKTAQGVMGGMEKKNYGSWTMGQVGLF